MPLLNAQNSFDPALKDKTKNQLKTSIMSNFEDNDSHSCPASETNPVFRNVYPEWVPFDAPVGCPRVIDLNNKCVAHWIQSKAITLADVAATYLWWLDEEAVPAFLNPEKRNFEFFYKDAPASGSFKTIQRQNSFVLIGSYVKLRDPYNGYIPDREDIYWTDQAVFEMDIDKPWKPRSCSRVRKPFEFSEHAPLRGPFDEAFDDPEILSKGPMLSNMASIWLIDIINQYAGSSFGDFEWRVKRAEKDQREGMTLIW